MLGLKRVHHIAIIATDYARSKAFYCDILGFTLQSEFIAPSATAIWRSTASM
jgi:glyoxylase I family protein